MTAPNLTWIEIEFGNKIDYSEDLELIGNKLTLIPGWELIGNEIGIDF